jgi:hypothetical protein
MYIRSKVFVHPERSILHVLHTLPPQPLLVLQIISSFVATASERILSGATEHGSDTAGILCASSENSQLWYVFCSNKEIWIILN